MCYTKQNNPGLSRATPSTRFGVNGAAKHKSLNVWPSTRHFQYHLVIQIAAIWIVNFQIPESSKAEERPKGICRVRNKNIPIVSAIDAHFQCSEFIVCAVSCQELVEFPNQLQLRIHAFIDHKLDGVHGWVVPCAHQRNQCREVSVINLDFGLTEIGKQASFWDGRRRLDRGENGAQSLENGESAEKLQCFRINGVGIEGLYLRQGMNEGVHLGLLHRRRLFVDSRKYHRAQDGRLLPQCSKHGTWNVGLSPNTERGGQSAQK
ncbi:hypothetical protein K438DRAFT_1747326 [Mycena galopus ATCC 62051]|nr:hypothetical protein K438DRAFT_1747326 [Mycena galopus ATCC 62051]